AKLSGRGSGYTITTPTAVAGVRGNSFEVEVNPGTGGSTVKVVTGEVAVTGGQPGDLETVIVRPDESTDVAWEKTPGRPKAVDPDKLDAWQRKNKELDQEDVQRWEDEKQQRKEFLNQLKEKKKELNELHREMGDALRQLAAEMKDIPAAKLEALFEEKGIRKQPPGQEKKQEGQVETGVEPSENESAGAESSGDNPPDLQKNGNGKSNGKGSQVSRERLEQLIETIQSIAQTQDDHQNVQGTPEESEEPGKPDKPDKPEKPGKP
ncbi:MAG: hypothetical protein HYY09_08855, partial [Firmicutes bacterium]|nr:hypothetical protein [Bacillota bacterium]